MFLKPAPKKELNSKSGAGFPTRAWTMDTSLVVIPWFLSVLSLVLLIGPFDGLTQPSDFSTITPPINNSPARGSHHYYTKFSS